MCRLDGRENLIITERSLIKTFINFEPVWKLKNRSDVIVFRGFGDRKRLLTNHKRGSVLTRASVKLFELGVRTPGGLFWRTVRRGYPFSAFLYPRPSYFRHNLRPTRNDEVVLDIRHSLK